MKVRGFLNETPLIQFLQKGKGVTNITGEKLYESQVIQAIKQIEKNCSLSSVFFMMLADENMNRYQLFLEPEKKSQGPANQIATEVDKVLCKLNIEYANKRESGRLASVQAFWLCKGTFDRYKRYCLEHGQRESQFKLLALQNKKDFSFSIGGHTLN